MMTLDDSPMEKMSDDEPLEHSVLDAAVTCRPVVGGASSAPVTVFDYDDGPGERAPDGRWGSPFGSDPELTLSDGPHATGIVDRI